MRRLIALLAAALALAAGPGQAEPYRALPRLAPAQVQHRHASAQRTQRVLRHGEGLVGPTVPELEPAPPAEVAEEAPGAVTPEPAVVVVADPAPGDGEEAFPVLLAAGPERPDESGPGPADAPGAEAPPAAAEPSPAPAPAAAPADDVDDAELRGHEAGEDDEREEQRRTSLIEDGPAFLAVEDLSPAAPSPAAPAAPLVPAAITTRTAPAAADDLAVELVTAQEDGTVALLLRTPSGDRVAVVTDGAGRLLWVTGVGR